MGITLNLTPVRITADANGEGAALERARQVTDACLNGVFLEPVLSGRYPEHALPALLPPDGLIEDSDMATIAAPLDFLGVNYYRRHVVKAGANGSGPTVVEAEWEPKKIVRDTKDLPDLTDDELKATMDVDEWATYDRCMASKVCFCRS